MVDAIAAAELPVKDVRRAMMYAPRSAPLRETALLRRGAGLAKFQLEVLSPIAPMLAQTAADPADALAQLGGEAAFEWKLDGARIQVHKAGNIVRVYTRNLNEVDYRDPGDRRAGERIARAGADARWRSDRARRRGRPHPFQVTMRRFGRKLDVERCARSCRCAPSSSIACDSRAKSLADRPTRERFAALERARAGIARVPRLVTTSAEKRRRSTTTRSRAGHEGVMAKSLDAPYEAGNRGASWLKIKRVHTLDLVVLAAEWGHGRRTGKLSNLHLGALDPRPANRSCSARHSRA